MDRVDGHSSQGRGGSNRAYPRDENEGGEDEGGDGGDEEDVTANANGDT